MAATGSRRAQVSPWPRRSAAIAWARSYQLAPPLQLAWYSPAGPGLPAAMRATSAVEAAARAAQLVGLPSWSATTRTSARSRSRRCMVSRKLWPWRLYSQLLRRIRCGPPAAAMACSPLSLLCP
ncbi:hypothetical protein D3C81_1707460 [compost metagenome]